MSSCMIDSMLPLMIEHPLGYNEHTQTILAGLQVTTKRPIHTRLMVSYSNLQKICITLIEVCSLMCHKLWIELLQTQSLIIPYYYEQELGDSDFFVRDFNLDYMSNFYFNVN